MVPYEIGLSPSCTRATVGSGEHGMEGRQISLADSQAGAERAAGCSLLKKGPRRRALGRS